MMSIEERADKLIRELERLPIDLPSVASPDQWQRLPDTVYGLIGMLSRAGSMRREDIAILSDALGICREVLRRRPAEFGGPRECR